MAGALREAIRRFARQENEIGFACSFVLSLFQNGWKETTPMLLEHHTVAEQRSHPEMPTQPGGKGNAANECQ